MSFWFFVAASCLCAIWLAVHLVLGGRDIARPLLDTTALSPVVRDTHYLCWHFTSVAIGCMSGFFGWAAATMSPQPAIAGTILAAAFTVSGIGLVLMRGGRFAELPQGWLFLPVTVLGLTGILS